MKDRILAILDNKLKEVRKIRPTNRAEFLTYQRRCKDILAIKEDVRNLEKDYN